MTDGTTATATPNSDASQSTGAAPAAATTATDASTQTQQPPADGSKPAATDGAGDLSKTEGDTTKATDGAKPADAPKDDAATAAKTGAPEAYTEFALPDGVTFTPETVAKITTAAKDMNLPQEGAQKLATLAAEYKQGLDADLNAKVTAVRAGWENDAKTDKEFGGDNFEVNVAIAKKAVEAFGSPAFKQMLKDTGVGSHPEFVRTFLAIGKSISQDTIVDGNNTGGQGVVTTPQNAFSEKANKMYGGNKKAS